ncbi:hypothetical protein EMIT0324P_11164 [Pseudomonas chlororaphis]|jgi:hypothetical protein
METEPTSTAASVLLVKQPDWEAIERAYRAGALSIRTIAERNGI